MDKLFLVISLVLYFLAPSQFSSSYSYMLLLVFIANAIYLFARVVRYEKIGFNLFFTIAFFLVSYLYPIFIYPFFPNFQILSIPLFDYDTVTICTALANVAYACYSVGVAWVLNIEETTSAEKKTKELHFNGLAEILTEKQLRVLMMICIVLFTLFVMSGGLSFFREMYQDGGARVASGITGFIWVFFQTSCLLLMIANQSKDSIVIYSFLAIVILLLLATGTRTLPLNLLTPIICCYCLKKNLSFTKIIIAGSILVVFFMAIGMVRSSDAMDAAGGDSIAEKFRSFADFIIPNRDLYAIYNHVQEEGITFGISSMSYILSVTPFAQSLFVKLTGIPEYQLSSERMTTFWEFGDDPDAWGLGTNIIGDVYLSFGFIGIIILFTLLGYIATKTQSLMRHQSTTGTIIYLTLVSNSIFMCRGAYFYSLKNIIWSLAFVYIMKCLYKAVTYDKKNNKITVISPS